MIKKSLLLTIVFVVFRTATAQAQEESGEVSSLSKSQSQEEPCCPVVCCPVYTKNFYARIFSGPNFLQSTSIQGNNSTYDVGYIIDGSVGFNWRCYGLRLEGEYAYRRNGIDRINFFVGGASNNGYVQTSSAMANLLWDLVGCSFCNIQPFIGAGLGYDFVKMHATNTFIVFNQHWNTFSGQVMAGFSYPIFRNGEITLEYKFHQGGSHFSSHSVGVALVYQFGFLR